MTRQPAWKLNARLLLMALLLLGMGGYLCWGLNKLAVEETESYQAAVRATSIVTTYQSGTRGTITDRYGNVLAYDETTYNVKFYRDPDKTSPVDSARYTHSLMEAIRIIEAAGGTIEEHFYIRLNNDGTYRYDFGVTSESAIASRKKNFVEACRFSDPDITPERAYLILRESWQIPDDMPYDEAKKIMSIRQDAVLNSWHAYEGVVIAYDVNLSVVTELDMLQSELVGVQTEMSGRRIYPYQDTACHLIGYMSKQVTTDMTNLGYSFDSFAPFVDGERTDNLLQLGYSYSDLIGVAGLEKSCEAYLTSHLISRQGTTTIEKTRTGSIVDVLGKTVPQGGLTVQTTLDIELQQVVEQALVHNIEETRLTQEEKLEKDWKKYAKLREDPSTIATAATGAIVVLGAKTGEVLAMASYPTYDPNVFTDGVDTQELEMLFGDNSNQPTLNRAIAIRTAPGSAFKMATGFAGLMEGAITTSTTISDRSPYYYFVDDPTTKVTANAPSCWTTTPGKHANLNLSRALAVSCNYFFFTVADRVGIKKLAYWAGQLGLEGTTGVELPGELSVQVGGQGARYDNTKPLSQQTSSIPRLIYNEIFGLLKRVTKEVDRQVSDETLSACAIRLLNPPHPLRGAEHPHGHQPLAHRLGRHHLHLAGGASLETHLHHPKRHRPGRLPADAHLPGPVRRHRGHPGRRPQGHPLGRHLLSRRDPVREMPTPDRAPRPGARRILGRPSGGHGRRGVPGGRGHGVQRVLQGVFQYLPFPDHRQDRNGPDLRHQQRGHREHELVRGRHAPGGPRDRGDGHDPQRPFRQRQPRGDRGHHLLVVRESWANGAACPRRDGDGPRACRPAPAGRNTAGGGAARGGDPPRALTTCNRKKNII